MKNGRTDGKGKLREQIKAEPASWTNRPVARASLMRAPHTADERRGWPEFGRQTSCECRVSSESQPILREDTARSIPLHSPLYSYAIAIVSASLLPGDRRRDAKRSLVRLSRHWPAIHCRPTRGAIGSAARGADRLSVPICIGAIKESSGTANRQLPPGASLADNKEQT